MTGTFASWGIGPLAEEVYRAVLRLPGREPVELADLTGHSRDNVVRAVDRLAAAGLVVRGATGVVPAPPESALRRLLARTMDDCAARTRGVDRLLATIPALEAETPASAEPAEAPPATGVRLVLGPQAMASRAVALVRPGAPVLACLRADAGGEASLLALCGWVAGRAGPASRLLVDADTAEQPGWRDAVEPVRGNAVAGAGLRVSATVPVTFVLVPGAGALLAFDPECPDAANGLYVDEPALLSTLEALFARLWDGAAAAPAGGDGLAELDFELLRLLMVGAKDDAIARQLNVSSRTVRRRLAALLSELGAESRFQAGVFAVRRGLL